nr:transposon tx1 uncharacterized 149 kda protein [Quercus suber]
MEDEADSDCEESSLCEGMVAVSLSKEEKIRIRVLWGNAIIVKTFGRKVGFLFLSTKLRSMWRPSGRMDIIDLGNDFFLVKFELKIDLDVVLKGGPWFVGQQFLAIRKWEPEFKAEEATLSSVAVWIRLPGLPIEFYEPTILKKIGRAIGPVLRIDSFTANGARGRFARLCVQINIDQPLINTVKIGKMSQPVQYEGINMLCFACGRLGHRMDNCLAVVRSNAGTNTRPPTQSPPENQMASDSLVCDQAGDPLKDHTTSNADVVLEQVGKVYGEWMVVARKKKPNGKNSTHSNGIRVDETKGQDVPPNPRDPQAIPRDAAPDTRKDMKRKASMSNAGKDRHLGGNSQDKIGSSQGPIKGNKGLSYKASSTLSKPNHRKSVADCVVNHSLGWDQNPWLPKTLHNTNSLFCFGAGSSENDFSRLPLGKTSERGNNSCGEVNYCGNPKGPDGDHGVVQYRGDGGMEEYLPVNRDQCTTGVSSDDGRGVVHHSKPILALLDGSAKVSSVDVSAARASIRATPLRKIAECPGGNFSGAGDFAEENPPRETHRNGHHGKSVQGEASAVLSPFNSSHSQYLQQHGSVSSDHCPLLLSLLPNLGQRGLRPFRFQPMWLNHDGFPGVVREAWEGNSQDVCFAVENFTRKAKTWNKEVFGDIFWRKRNLTTRLLGAEKALANNPSQRLIDIHKFLSGEMEKILVLEEELWGMKARINWLIQGERNTTFFHITALNRRSSNRIVGINDSNGNWIVDIDRVKEIFLMGFKKLYSSEQVFCERTFQNPFLFENSLSDSEAFNLTLPPSDAEILFALNSMKAFKAPGPDGLHAGFFQRFWLVVGDSVKMEVKRIFQTKKVPQCLNRTLIALIPKNLGPETISHFRPISLCNTLYKVV